MLKINVKKEKRESFISNSTERERERETRGMGHEGRNTFRFRNDYKNCTGIWLAEGGCCLVYTAHI